jgi:uncharacterized protein (DUF58 family)
MTGFQRRFPGFSLHPSRVFWIFLVAVPLLALAALNTGNNALYLLLSVAMGAFVGSGALSRHTLKCLSAEALPPATLHAGTPVTVEIVIHNASSWLSAVGLTCSLVGMPGEVLLATVPPRGESRGRLVTLFPRRGKYAVPALRVEVRLPLGFFVKRLRIPQRAEVLVYPRRFPGAAVRFAGAPLGELETRAGGVKRGGEVDQLREFQPGDDRRDIHWKQTARQQRMIVLERRERAERSRFLVLDRQLPRRDDPEMAERFEDLVSEVASAALGRLRKGDAVGLVVGSAITPAGRGRRHAGCLLERLALVQAVGPGEDPLPVAVAGGRVYRLVGAP